MNTFADLSNGERITALIGTYDINRFTAISRSLTPEAVYLLITEIGEMVSRRVAAANGMVVKYIGDSALYLFPDQAVDRAMGALLTLKSEMESLFAKRGWGNTVTFALHYGEVIVGKIPPFDTWDILGDAVNIAFSLDRGPYRGQFVITPQAFRKLSPATRKLFHKHTPPIVYLSEPAGEVKS